MRTGLIRVLARWTESLPNEQLITRHLQGETTPAEAMALAAWRLAAPENDEEYRTLAGLWSLVERASPITDDLVPPDVDAVITAAEEQEEAATASRGSAPLDVPGSGRKPARRSGSWGPPFLMGTLAASVAFLAVGLGLVADRLSAPAAGEAYRTVATGADAGVTLTLYDGTAVRLAPSSELRVLEVGDHPVVQLTGRAYFGVVPDPSRTFTVQTAYGEATALGTRFEVRTDQRELQVLVVQGHVRVTAAGSSVEIGESMMTRSAAGESIYTTRVDDVHAHLAWLGQTLVFRATPLSEVAMEIGRRYNVEVTLETPSLGNLAVTAIFTDQPVADVIFVVCRIVGAHCAMEDGRRYRIGVPDDVGGILRGDSVVRVR